MEHLSQVWNLEKARLLNADHFLLTNSGGFFNFLSSSSSHHLSTCASPHRGPILHPFSIIIQPLNIQCKTSATKSKTSKFFHPPSHAGSYLFHVLPLPVCRTHRDFKLQVPSSDVWTMTISSSRNSATLVQYTTSPRVLALFSWSQKYHFAHVWTLAQH
jgi:hypothetical protein